ncbi:hypothetical protein [Methylocystis parvus]|uniref:DUF748 domain-containing protein n=1 Tax=Methylocystis parvus TaxID=134 RepID=A0A6B8M796_9HYPH|nr:hypothetical protein [Methylocystis parvus]QGM98346.1 hypothetical protein F7D14_13230 [Methylocystis parvus]WBK01326.1 hypothetical protein MMG94_06345 [Methylocystis parvus OBBP]
MLLAAGAALLAPFAALEAAEGNLVLDNVTLALGGTTYRIPHMELTGATLTAAEFGDLLKGDEKAADGRLARLSAKSLVIPAMTAESVAGGETARMSYRDVRAEDIRAGRIATLRTAGAEQTLDKADGGSERIALGPSAAKGVDLRQLVHMSLGVRLDPQEALKPAIDEESVESVTLQEKDERVTVKTGRITLKGVKGRALASRPSEIMERLEKYEPDKSAADPALLKDLIDAVSSLDVASIEIRDIVANGKGEPADKPYAAKLGRLSAGRIANGTIGDFAFEDFSLQSSDGGRLSLARFALRDARLASFFDNPIPLIGHIEAKGLSGDLPDIRASETSRMKFGLAGAEADFSDLREIAPTKFSARMDDLSIDIASRGETPSTAQFLALGYRNLDLSAALAGEWREKTQEAVFAPLRVVGKDMGALSMNVTFGDVSGAVFSAMPVVSKAAALASSLRSVALTVEGGDLVDRVLALEAKQAKKPLDKLRADYAKSAGTAVAVLLGGGEKARRIGEAVSAYVLKPTRLSVRLSSQKGVGALDALAKQPADILESLDVEAVAER